MIPGTLWFRPAEPEDTRNEGVAHILSSQRGRDMRGGRTCLS